MSSSTQHKRTSLFDIPVTISPGSGDHLVDVKGPLNTASTVSENLLLEYTEGMEQGSVGWGCVHRSDLESIMNLHTAATDFAQRTPEIARAQASNLLDHIDQTMQQVVQAKPMSGALGKENDRALFLIGHDTSLENIAGLLGLPWIIDGRRDDTLPGGALIFELWRQRKARAFIVKTYFTAQTLDQMRSSTVLSLSNPPSVFPFLFQLVAESTSPAR